MWWKIQECGANQLADALLPSRQVAPKPLQHVDRFPPLEQEGALDATPARPSFSSAYRVPSFQEEVQERRFEEDLSLSGSAWSAWRSSPAISRTGSVQKTPYEKR